MADGNYIITNKIDGSTVSVNHEDAWENATQNMNDAKTAKERQNALSDYLQGIGGVVNSHLMERETFSRYGETYKDVYTAEERKKQASKKGTELWHKKKNAQNIEKQEKIRLKKMQTRAEAARKKGRDPGTGQCASYPGAFCLYGSKHQR